ncbi:MAG: CoA transferase [Rubrivivax sp.]|nr:MAG: CoA transferase [Rubrivivax sp.]
MRTNTDNLPRPLEGVTVLDLTTALAGPYATLLLAGLGARVIKIENPKVPDTARNNAPFLGRDGVAMVRRHDDDMSLAIMERARNKQSITLNLKSPKGKALFEKLVAKADAVVENYSAGTADRLGTGYAACAAINPRIVYTSISGFGANMVSRQNKAMDTIVQALSGLMMTSGEAGSPPVRVGVPFGDLTAPLFAVIGTLSALMQARSTGQGQHVDVSLLGAITALVASEPFEVMRSAGQQTRSGNTMPRLAPFGVFATQDGYVAVCAPTDGFTSALFNAMNQPHLAADPRFASRDQRVRNSSELHALLQAWMGTVSTDDAVEALEAAGVPSGRVRDPGEATRDERLLARGETERIEHPIYGTVDDIIVGGLPIRMTGSFAGFDKPAPNLGEHNGDIYGELLGLDTAELGALSAEGVI